MVGLMCFWICKNQFTVADPNGRIDVQESIVDVGIQRTRVHDQLWLQARRSASISIPTFSFESRPIEQPNSSYDALQRWPNAWL